MAATQWPFLAAVLLLLSSGLHCSSSLPTCPQSCNCQRATLLNCSSSGLSSVPQLIQDSVTELDLSHNLLDSVTLHRPHRNLRNVRLGNNTIAHLSLCIDRNLDGKYLRGRRGLRPWSRGRCVPWAPTLQLLSVERNLLEQLPEGLEGVGSLQVLQLSFNRISTLRPEDLSHLNQLKELDLKHNLITSLHPQMFQDLVQLKVLDLSFNMLTSLNPLMYFTLRNIGVDVGLGGNRWKCDCSMRSLRRRMAHDSSRGLQIWKMVCAFPSALSGRDLLQLEEDDLNCFSTEISPELHQDVTVYSGSEILLSCSTEDSVWWTPNGQASVSHPQAGLLISGITERDTGLYVCVSEENQVVSVFNLQISQIGGAKRKPRSVPNISRQIIPQGLNRIGELRNQTTTQSDLALAVCLSILFTFLIAFILGVLARPCIDVLWKRVTTKKRSTETHVVSSVEQRQYDNEAYSIGEEQEAAEHFRERRVTFSDVDHREENNVQYYDTVASGDQESIDNDEVFDGEAAEAKRAKRTAGDSGSDSSSLQSNQGDEQDNGRDLSGKASAGQTHNMEFERIPDSSELEKRRTMSSSSDSSQSENEVDHTTPKSPQVALDSLQQKSDLPTTGKVEVPQISIEARSEIHGFSSEPFSDWSPYKNSTDHAVLQENEDLFEFSDSTRSSSAFDSFNDPKLPVAPTSDKKKGDDMSSSSSSSHVSEDEHYTVNSDNKKGDYRHDTKRPAPRPGHSFSSDSSDSDDEPVQSTVKQAGKEKLIHENDKLSNQTVPGEKDVSEKIKPMPRTKWRSVGLAVASVSKGVAPSPPARHSSTSSSDNEAQITDLKGKQNKRTVSQKKVTLNNNAPSPSSGSSSSSDSEEETTKHIRKQEQGDVYMSRPPIKVSRTVSREQETQRPAVDFEHTTSIKRHLDIKAPSISSDSSSSSEDETTGQTKKQRDIHVTQLPLKGSQTGNHEPETKRPAFDLEYTTSIKRQVDIQAPSAPSDSSSSSDSEDETKGQTEKRRPGKFDTPQLTFQGSQTKSPDARWPTLDLQHIPRIKRRLDIKVPSQTSDSSSSSDSEEETKKFIKKQEHGNVHMPRFPIKVRQTVSHVPGTKRPAIDHQHTTSIKRHPGTKAQSASSDSSSSSDSEDDTTGHREKERPGKLNTAGWLLQKPQTKSPDPNAKWPTLDLLRVPRLKRRLDIKAPSAASDSSSSSDSEEETKSIKKQQQGELHMSRPSFKVSQTLSRDPGTHQTLLDLEHTTPIKKRPLIKAPSASSDSSSSSDSEVETTKSTGEQEQGKLHMPRPSIKVSQTVSHDPRTQRPLLDLDHTTPIKRHPDIKVPSASSDSSSTSDSDDETGHMEKQRSGKLITTGLPLQGSQTKRHDPDAKWPSLDLRHIPRLKRRLDIKAPSPASHSSSSSDSEEERTKSIKNHGELHMSRPSVKVSQTVSRNPGTQRPLLDLEYTAPTKRHPDIKEPSPASDSSSSSDSEDETTTHIQKPEQGNKLPSRPPNKVSPTVSHDPRTQRPLLDLDHTTPIKRHPDIKVPSASSDSSSTSDSDDETGHMEKQRSGKWITTGLPLQGSQTKRHDPDAKWPSLDLRHIPRLKRRLDIKAPSPASHSSSSSDSEEERKKSIKNHGELHMSRPSVKVSQTVSRNPGTQRPLLDLEYTAPTKRHPDIKETTPASDSSSSSDSDDETGHMEKQRSGKLITTGLPLQGSQTKRHYPDAKWPSLDLWHIPRLKRRLDIKAPSPASHSSSSSDSEEERKKSIKNHGELHMSRPSVKVSQTVSRSPGTQRPLLDLEYTAPTKRHPDIKEPSPASDSSSSSDSDDETGHMEKQRSRKLITTGLPLQGSQTKRHDPDAKWPGLDLRHIPRLKRHLDIKVPSPASHSSSSSDSEEERKKSIKNNGELHMSRPSVKVSQTVSRNPGTQRPLLDLEYTAPTKRHPDIKEPSPASDPSSSSDSEDETTTHIQKPEQGNILPSRPPNKVSPTVSHDPRTQRPLLDLDHTTPIKRHPDIKVPSASSDSSSTSDSDDETGHMEKQRSGKLITTGLPLQGSQTKLHDPDAKWPSLDLRHIPRLKRRLDVKAPSPASHSSSSSDSEEERKKSIKNHGELHMSRPSVKVSQTVSRNPGTQRPLLDLEYTAPTKRHPDIKEPSPASDSSSSSDSDDEMGHMEKQRSGKLITTGLPLQGSQTKRHDPDAKWPGLDLRHIPRLKRRLDIKAPSPASYSSSSSDSEEERTKSIKNNGELHMSRPSVKVSQTVSRNPGTQRPLLDLEYTAPTKRHPDIKEPSPASDSSSSSDSEDETTTHIQKPEQGNILPSRPPNKVSPTIIHEPETRWPLLDLERTTSVKQRLDIKPLSAASDSSSSSDSDDETSHMEKQRPGKLIMTGLPLQGFQRKSHDPDAKWPSLDLWHIPRLKRRLDIKAPSPASDSSSSSDSEEERTKSIKNHGELHMSRPSIKVSQTVSCNPGTQRPLLDLEYTTPIKRHPDIKEPSPASDSSSSSDSEDETTTHIQKPEQGNILPSRPPNKVSPTVIHEPETRWPLLDLERTTSVKRRLDIKPLSAASDSSSSSDSDDETTKHMKKQEQQPPVKVSQTVSLKPETQRPAINLEHTTSMKKQLDAKAPSASSDSSSTSDSDDETGHMEMQRPGKLITTGLPFQGSQTKRHDPDAKWSGLDLRHIPRLKRHLDVKAPSPAFHSSSSSNSEEETTKSIKKQQQGELHMSRPSVKVSQTVSRDPGTQRPLLNLEHTTPIKRHPDIKAPSPASDSSSSSDSEDETTTSTMKKGDVHVAQLPSKMSQTASHKPETRWPLLDLEHTTSIKRRLDIKTVPSGSSSSNDSGGEQTTTYIKKQNQAELHLSRLPIEISQTVSQKPESRQPAISLEHTASIKTRQDVKAPSADSDSSSSSDSENETTGHTEKQRPGKFDIAGLPFRQSPSVDLGNITHKKRLDIKVLPTQPDLGLKNVSLGSRKSESSSSTSDSEDEKRDHKAKVGAGVSVTSKVPEKDLMSFPKTPLRNIFHSPKTEHNIKLIKYTVVSDDVGNKPTNDSIHKTPEISSELQSRWATMNLGLSRSRKRLESTSQKQKSSDLPSSPPPDSPSYSGESGPGSPISRTRLKRKDVGITLTGSSLIHDNKLVNASPTMKDQSDTMFGFGAPHNTKHLDIRGSEKAPATASQQQPDSSSSSDTEDERVDHIPPDLSFGIPRIRRHLNIKAPSPEPSSSSSSSSESEKEVQKYSDKQSRYALKTTDSDSAITYKRAIIKTSSLPGNSLSPSGKSQSVDHANAPTSPRTAPSMSFDDTVKSRIQQSKRKTDLDLPPKLTWPGVGHHPSDLSISTPNLNTASIQPASLAEPKPPPAYTSSTKSDIKIKQDSGKSDVTIVHKHSSLRADPVSPTSRGALHKLMNLSSNIYETARAVTEDTREGKGLKALKNMALERQKWEAEDLNRGPFSLFDGSIQPSDTSFDYRGSEADIKVLSKQPLTHLPSASIIERRATDLSYEVPHYRSHNVREPSHAIPPAIPATPPPPYEAAGLTWRSPQNTQKQVWEGNISHQQQRKSSEGSDTSSENSNSLNFDYSNAISHV